MKKLIVFLFVIFMVSLLCVNSYAKYVVDNTLLVADINIDGEIPKIEFSSVDNTNKERIDYANKTHTITIEFGVRERNIKEDNTLDNMKFLLDDDEFNPKNKNVAKTSMGEYVYYTVTLTGITGNGRLKLKVPEGSVVDIADQVNKEAIFDTGITIDNIAPVVSFLQEEIGDGRINAKIIANETIRNVNAWKLSDDNTVLSKEFACNVLYPFFVTDLAGNSTSIDVRIDKATNIQLRYSAGKRRMGFETGTGLNEIIGKKFLTENQKYKIEAVGLWWEGLDKDFLGENCYIYTNWGEGKKGRCNYAETDYIHGYNPGQNEFATLGNSITTNVNGYYGIYLGGLNVNFVGYEGISGGKPVPAENEGQYLFGISSLNIKLKDYSYYSIVYQIWVEGQGWLEPVSDGKETTLAHDKPIGAYRMSLIPKTEKQYLIDLWQKDVGTNNMK